MIAVVLTLAQGVFDDMGSFDDCLRYGSLHSGIHHRYIQSGKNVIKTHYFKYGTDLDQSYIILSNTYSINLGINRTLDSLHHKNTKPFFNSASHFYRLFVFIENMNFK